MLSDVRHWDLLQLFLDGKMSFFLTNTHLKFLLVVKNVPGLCNTCCHPLISAAGMCNVPNSVETAAEICSKSAILVLHLFTGQCPAPQTSSWCSPEPKLLPLPGKQRQLCSQLLHVRSLPPHSRLFCLSEILIMGVLSFLFGAFSSFFLKSHDHLKVSLPNGLNDQCRKIENYNIMCVGCE